MVDGPRHDFFAAAGLAGDQHGYVGAGHAPGAFQDLEHGLADDYRRHSQEAVLVFYGHITLIGVRGRFPDTCRTIPKMPIERPGPSVIGEYSIPWKAKLYIGAVIRSGLFVLASLFKVKLPGLTGAMSVNYAFIVLSMLEFSYGETMVLDCVAMAVQTGWRVSKRTKPVHFLFNCSSMALAVSAGCATYRVLALPGKLDLLALAAATTGFFLVNSFSIATVVSLTEGKSALTTWRGSCFWSFVYYM